MLTLGVPVKLPEMRIRAFLWASLSWQPEPLHLDPVIASQSTREPSEVFRHLTVTAALPAEPRKFLADS